MQPSNKASPMTQIWHIVSMIPEGKVCSYGKVADLAGLPGRARYVSRALKAAPSELALPWHRVINSQGKISFAEHSEPFIEQMQRLRSEAIIVNRGRVKLAEYEWRPDLATLVLSMPF
ncbi:MGMT family protein [Shewanella fidelis]|uniref:Methylated-DNA--[protein]-cysteine S-methyltransferase n=1 Tax=Shewanella fidelis TaxID=173509 RepID=A0AAW8NMR2_9GAMM|nr:methylated-DNA--[protein]-cysteine S-methyltransferase [Shewanella fidelis]MDR8524050.1 methylated-DNA--[protein]-cysteine S-methyltransferase [Shewanella fidelis]MDW4810597.1 methylated-DNA--[protein]-cysteine S-methyltransferase [Shewanella fidelis]MDW4814718.1 methylated-DNA--[protein]-cysteine S-methyltransferase [Shewanella fidelis]MDW4818808.1 methylated-DNA--[protein]-cysteine S-methyltransferase [Shewanella fidelis]MDW4823515.1 methylated-DNA--[protein]-cysteine S-methyltransferase 